MQYRYSRGQSGQSSLPRPAWGSGNHGARAASPEPGGNAGASVNSGGEPAKAREERPDEVILQLENEVAALSNACSVKDQRIAELSRTYTPVARLKRDVRQLSAELHATRKQLSESVSEQQKLQAQLSGGETSGALGRDAVAAPVNDMVESPAGVGRGADIGVDRANTSASNSSEKQLRDVMERLTNLEEENCQLREALAAAKVAPSRDQNFYTLHHTRQSSGASTQRTTEPQNMPGAGGGFRATDLNVAIRSSYMVAQLASAGSAPTPGGLVGAGVQQEEPVRSIVYSTAHLEHAKTLGPTMVQGVGTVDGVSSVAKVLLQRIHSSVCNPHNAHNTRPPCEWPAARPSQPSQLVLA